MTSPWQPDPDVQAGALAILRPLQRYHHHHVAGLEHVPRQGRVLLVMHHTFATYDSFLFGVALHEFTGRTPRGLGDNLIFKTPVLGRWGRGVGLVPASPTAGRELLEQEQLVGVAPGGMWEALRDRKERYRVRWGRRRGFVRLALRTGSPMLLAACRMADDLYTVYDNRLTRAVYRRFKAPLPVVRGLGPTLLPRPVPLTHHVAPPIVPPVYNPAREADQIEALFADACATMDRLLHSADPGVPVFNGPPTPSRP